MRITEYFCFHTICVLRKNSFKQFYMLQPFRVHIDVIPSPLQVVSIYFFNEYENFKTPVIFRNSGLSRPYIKKKKKRLNTLCRRGLNIYHIFINCYIEYYTSITTVFISNTVICNIRALEEYYAVDGMIPNIKFNIFFLNKLRSIFLF